MVQESSYVIFTSSFEFSVVFSFKQDSPPASSLTNPYHAGYLFKAGMVYGCVPTWKHRWCIVKGGYLFKYSSPNVRDQLLVEKSDAVVPFVFDFSCMLYIYDDFATFGIEYFLALRSNSVSFVFVCLL
jgi:hypothetical protein